MTTTTLDAPNSGNPAITSRAAERLLATRGAATMTVAGTSVKTLVLLLFLVAGGSWGWAAASPDVAVPDAVRGYANTTVTIPGGFWLASIAAFLVAIFLAVNPQAASILGILYALLQGFCLGAISAMFDAQTQGIVAAAVLATVGVFVVSWFLYVTGIVKPTQRLAFAVVAGLGGLALLYLFVWVLAIVDVGFLYSEQFRVWGVVISVVAVVLAALSLTLDFAFVRDATDAGAPKFMEWYLAFSLMVTLVWLYLTLLRLFALLSGNR
jgi:hypothetical protein